MLHLLRSADKPLLRYPPDYQQLAFLVDRSIRKKNPEAKIKFDKSLLGNPFSTDVENNVTNFAILELIETKIDKKHMTPLESLSTTERPYFDNPVMLNPIFSIPFILLETARYASNKIRGKKNLPIEYKRAEKELKENFLGQEGLKEMERLAKKYAQTSLPELYAQALALHEKETSSSTTA